MLISKRVSVTDAQQRKWFYFSNIFYQQGQCSVSAVLCPLKNAMLNCFQAVIKDLIETFLLKGATTFLVLQGNQVDRQLF